MNVHARNVERRWLPLPSRINIKDFSHEESKKNRRKKWGDAAETPRTGAPPKDTEERGAIQRNEMGMMLAHPAPSYISVAIYLLFMNNTNV